MAKKIVPAEQIRRVRRLLGETQAQFAKRLAVDPVTVGRWEIGQRTCSGLHALTVARLDPTGALFEALDKESEPMTKSYKTIAFFSHKGGVSKTTTTYNLGWALANAGKRVLMIDGDPQCNLTGMTLSLEGQEDFEKLYESDNRANLYDALRPAFEAIQAWLAVVGKDVATMPATASLWPAVRNGRGITSGTFYTNLRRYLKEAYLPAGGVHIFRHSAAKLRRDAGETVEDVSRFLDHSNLATTTTYLRRLEGQEDRSWAKVAEAIRL